MATEGVDAVRSGKKPDIGMATRVTRGPRQFGNSVGRPNSLANFPYDRNAGLIGGSQYHPVTGVASIMSRTQAVAFLSRIHNLYGIAQESEGVCYAFDQALFLSLAFNGTSVLTPTERVQFGFFGDDGFVHEYEITGVYNLLKGEIRRFGRFYANEIYTVCKSLFVVDMGDIPEVTELRDLAVVLSEQRGVGRTPWCFADVLDACTIMPKHERDAYAVSKQGIIAGSANVADRGRPAMKIESSDGYVSGLGGAPQGVTKA